MRYSLASSVGRDLAFFVVDENHDLLEDPSVLCDDELTQLVSDQIGVLRQFAGWPSWDHFVHKALDALLNLTAQRPDLRVIVDDFASLLTAAGKVAS